MSVGATEDRRSTSTARREGGPGRRGDLASVAHRPPRDGAAVCVMTRFRVRRPWDVVRAYFEYRRVARDARAAVGDSLIHTVFLVENLRTCYSLSIWRDEAAIGQFGTQVPRHVSAAGRIFPRLARTDDGNPELWATRWRLMRLSNNRNWRESGLDELISDSRIEGGDVARG